jgi:hypothetical protein
MPEVERIGIRTAPVRRANQRHDDAPPPQHRVGQLDHGEEPGSERADVARPPAAGAGRLFDGHRRSAPVAAQ